MFGDKPKIMKQENNISGSYTQDLQSKQKPINMETVRSKSVLGRMVREGTCKEEIFRLKPK